MCDRNVTGNYDTSTGVLNIPGTGKMYSYSDEETSGRYDYRDKIKLITIEKGVASIAEGSFYNCNALPSIAISDSVISIEVEAFNTCSSLKEVNLNNDCAVLHFKSIFPLYAKFEKLTIDCKLLLLTKRHFIIKKTLNPSISIAFRYI